VSTGPARDLLAYIVANVNEDTPRLAYADWLEEAGHDARAEFVRVQVERARRPAWDAAQIPLRLREQALLDRHGEGWLAELPAVEGARWEGFRRGVVAEVSFASFEAMRANVRDCRAVAPVEAVTVRWPRRRESRLVDAPIAELRELSLTGVPDGENGVGWLAESPQLSPLRSLTARGLWADSLRRLVASPHLAGLKVLRLPSNNLGNPGLAALTQSPSLAALEELDLSALGRHERYNHDPIIRAAGMGLLMGWPGLARVRTLTLTGNDVSRDGLRALLRSPHAGALKELTLRDGRLDGQAMAEFHSALPALRLESLDLGQNVLKAVGAEYVAIAPCLSELKALRLDRCEISRDGATLFAKKAGFLGGLRLLDIGHNHFGPFGLRALLAREPASLHTLRMRDNDLFDKGAESLAGSPASDTLMEVDLSQNGLGAAAARALGDSEYLRGLVTLRLADNRIDDSAAATLAASPLGRRLAVLELVDSPPPAPDPPPAPEPDPPPALELPPALDLPPGGPDDIPF
jgi:uncharacterized protein (TIGR02996 family)